MSAARDALRSTILSTKTPAKQEVVFFGSKIELRQPVLSDIINAQSNENRESVIIETLVDYAYVPGTDEKVFETGDIATFKGMPFGADFLRVSKALEALTEVNFLDTNVPSTLDQTST